MPNPKWECSCTNHGARRTFDTEQECFEHEAHNGFAGPVRAFLDHHGYEGQSRSMARNLLVKWLDWTQCLAGEEEGANDVPRGATEGAEGEGNGVDTTQAEAAEAASFASC